MLFAMIFSIFSGITIPEKVEAAEPTQANIAKILVGKTKEEVEAISGAATKEVFLENSGWYEEFWHYSGGY